MSTKENLLEWYCDCEYCGSRVDQLQADLTALRAEVAEFKNPTKWMQWCDHKILERAEAAEAQVAALKEQLAQCQQARARQALTVHERQESWQQMRDELEAERAARAALVQALEESVKLQSHYASLLNMHDGGRRLQFANADEWLKRLASLTPSPQASPQTPPTRQVCLEWDAHGPRIIRDAMVYTRCLGCGARDIPWTPTGEHEGCGGKVITTTAGPLP